MLEILPKPTEDLWSQQNKIKIWKGTYGNDLCHSTTSSVGTAKLWSQQYASPIQEYPTELEPAIKKCLTIDGSHWCCHTMINDSADEPKCKAKLCEQRENWGCNCKTHRSVSRETSHRYWKTELHPHVEIEMDGHAESYIYEHKRLTRCKTHANQKVRQSEDIWKINSTADCFEFQYWYWDKRHMIVRHQIESHDMANGDIEGTLNVIW